MDDSKFFIFKTAPIAYINSVCSIKGLRICDVGGLNNYVSVSTRICQPMIALATDLAWWMRSLVGACTVVGVHIGVSLLVGVALVEVLEGTRLIRGRVTIITSWREANVVFGSKMLVAWIESWRKPWPLEVGGVLMVEV
jgi:hypothetical protein